MELALRDNPKPFETGEKALAAAALYLSQAEHKQVIFNVLPIASITGWAVEVTDYRTDEFLGWLEWLRE